MLQAMNTGHDGGMATIHANSAYDAIGRLQMLAGISGMELPTWYIDRQIASGVHLVIHTARLAGGVRRVTQISEVAIGESGQLTTRDIFTFTPTGVDASGKTVGRFCASSERPKCLTRLRQCGIAIPEIWGN